MSDVVVTVPMKAWLEWLLEGDLPGDVWTDREYFFHVSRKPKISQGERVYVFAGGRLRGYAPLVRFQSGVGLTGFLVRRGGAVAVTIRGSIRGFQGFRYRWWDRQNEFPFPGWKDL